MRYLAALVAFAATACISQTGPFVTNIAYAPDGRLVVDRCLLQYDNNSHEVSMTGCTRQLIAPPPAPPPVMSAPPAATPPR